MTTLPDPHTLYEVMKAEKWGPFAGAVDMSDTHHPVAQPLPDVAATVTIVREWLAANHRLAAWPTRGNRR